MASVTRRVGRPTGPKPTFSRDDVVRAALKIGVKTFTLGQVAQALGVGTPALYRTISSREDVLAACLEHIAAQVTVSDFPTDWPGQLRAYVDHVWDVLDTYPGLAEVIVTVPWAHQCFAGPVKGTLQRLVDAGLNSDDAILALDFVVDTALATHIIVESLRSPLSIDEGGANADSSGQVKKTGADIVRERYDLSGGSLPEMMRPTAEWTDRGWLDRKIDLIIDGLQAR